MCIRDRYSSAPWPGMSSGGTEPGCGSAGGAAETGGTGGCLLYTSRCV
ncbi:hypothetical protein [Streptomyces fragilis]|nr:hypothetical protein [Streptomyces fragilis]